MRRLASLALAGLTVLCLLAFPALADTAAPALAAAASASSGSVSISWGDGVAALVPLLNQVVPAVGVLVLWLIGRMLGAPAAATAKAVGIDSIITKALLAAVADVPGAVAGKELEVHNLSPVMAQTIDTVQTLAPTVIKDLGGMDAAQAAIKAQMSKLGLVPAAADASHFAA